MEWSPQLKEEFYSFGNISKLNELIDVKRSHLEYVPVFYTDD